MDYLYSELNASLITEDDENSITWKSYTALPTASSTYYMQVAVITTGNIDSIYLCIRGNSGYEWKLITSGSSPIAQLPAPTITLTGTLLSWSGISGAIGYKIYNNNTQIGSATSSASTFNLSTVITAPGDYSISVVAAGDQETYLDSEKSNVVSYSFRYKMYFGMEENTPTTVQTSYVQQDCPLDMASGTVNHNYTNPEEKYMHCVYSYPKYYGEVKHIYAGDSTAFDLLSLWTKIEITYNDMAYYLYYQNNPTYEQDHKYQYWFVLN